MSAADPHVLVQMTAIAVVVGILAQVVAERLRLPSIVFLLVFGVIVGPDVLGLVDPTAFGAGLRAIVTIAVAIILFEGGLQLHYVDVAAVGRAVRNLVTVGALVTVAGGALAAHFLAGLPWSLALLFGTIVSVTGPTVINPLLDRVPIDPRLDTVLRSEGVIIDPIGAILALVALEILVTADASILDASIEFATRMGIGVGIGLAGGWLLGRVLRVRRVFGPEIKNLAVLAWVLALFAAAEAMAAESGLAAVVVAGMAIRRESVPQQHLLRRFKSELSILFISILFILLSSFLRLETIAAVGWGGVWAVLALMWIVRPLNVLVSTWRTTLGWRERLFTMWISPRGVVAISIASFIAIMLRDGEPELVRAGLTAADGEAILALVFLTIAITVVVQGLTARPVAALLGVLAESGRRQVVVVGANAFGRMVGGVLGRYGWTPVLIDSNARQTARAQRSGLQAVTGNSLDRDVLAKVGIDSAVAMVALTSNQEINFLAARLALEEHHVPVAYPVLIALEEGAHEELVEEIGGELAFGRRIDVSRWNYDLRNGRAYVVTVVAGDEIGRGPLAEQKLPDSFVPLVTVRDGRADICHGGTTWRPGDRVVTLVREGAEESLREVVGREVEPIPEPVETR